MVQLPPDGDWLVQKIGDYTIVFHRHTEEEIVRFCSASPDENAWAQRMIHETDKLTPEEKCFAHFWCGYFYAHS